MPTPNKNPYVKNFLAMRPDWSSTSACHGEEAWDAAIDSVLYALNNHRYISKAALDDIKELRSTNQRAKHGIPHKTLIQQ
jgi:hypothetical protein